MATVVMPQCWNFKDVMSYSSPLLIHFWIGGWQSEAPAPRWSSCRWWIHGKMASGKVELSVLPRDTTTADIRGSRWHGSWGPLGPKTNSLRTEPLFKDEPIKCVLGNRTAFSDDNIVQCYVIIWLFYVSTNKLRKTCVKIVLQLRNRISFAPYTF